MIITLKNQDEFTNLTQSQKLTVVDFTAKWCGPCKAIKPVFEDFSNKFTNVNFATVDVDEVEDVAKACGVSSMPTFHFYVGGQKVHEIVGADKTELEKQILALGGVAGEEKVPGQIELNAYIDKRQLECLNSTADSNTSSIFTEKGKLLSDCDEQLIILVTFNQVVKLHSIEILADENGPKTIKTFVNRSSLSFDEVDDIQETETLNCVQGMNALRYVKYQSVHSIALFIADNQSGSDQTLVNSIKFYGSLGEKADIKTFNKE